MIQNSQSHKQQMGQIFRIVCSEATSELCDLGVIFSYPYCQSRECAGINVDKRNHIIYFFLEYVITIWGGGCDRCAGINVNKRHLSK